MVSLLYNLHMPAPLTQHPEVPQQKWEEMLEENLAAHDPYEEKTTSLGEDDDEADQGSPDLGRRNSPRYNPRKHDPMMFLTAEDKRRFARQERREHARREKAPDLYELQAQSVIRPLSKRERARLEKAGISLPEWVEDLQDYLREVTTENEAVRLRLIQEAREETQELLDSMSPKRRLNFARAVRSAAIVNEYMLMGEEEKARNWISQLNISMDQIKPYLDEGIRLAPYNLDSGKVEYSSENPVIATLTSKMQQAYKNARDPNNYESALKTAIFYNREKAIRWEIEREKERVMKIDQKEGDEITRQVFMNALRLRINEINKERATRYRDIVRPYDNYSKQLKKRIPKYYRTDSNKEEIDEGKIERKEPLPEEPMRVYVPKNFRGKTTRHRKRTPQATSRQEYGSSEEKATQIETLKGVMGDTQETGTPGKKAPGKYDGYYDMGIGTSVADSEQEKYQSLDWGDPPEEGVPESFTPSSQWLAENPDIPDNGNEPTNSWELWNRETHGDSFSRSPEDVLFGRRFPPSDPQGSVRSHVGTYRQLKYIAQG
jgi:hypothetical protein